MMKASIESLPSLFHRHRLAVILVPRSAILRPALDFIGTPDVVPREAGPISRAQVLKHVGCRIANVDDVPIEPREIADLERRAVLRHLPESSLARQKLSRESQRQQTKRSMREAPEIPALSRLTRPAEIP